MYDKLNMKQGKVTEITGLHKAAKEGNVKALDYCLLPWFKVMWL